MTLRARFSLFTSALLTVVLVAAGVVLERIESARVDRELERRAVELARGVAVERTARRPDPPPGAPLPPDDDTGPRPPGAPPPRDDGDPPRAATPRDDAAAPGGAASSAGPAMGDVRALRDEPDGAHAETFLLQMPPRDAPETVGLLLAHGATGPSRLTKADADRFAAQPPEAVARFAQGERTFVVATHQPPPRGGPPWRREGPGPPEGRGPRAPARLVAVAFLDATRAAEAHAARVTRGAVVGAVAVALGALLSFLLAGRMLRPVRVAAAAAEAIERPEQRLPAPASADELGRLVAVLNGMLARLEASSERERRFLATASHELRRPLTALLGELELATAPGRGADAVRASAVLALEDARSMRRLVEDLLHHARARAGALRLVEGEVDLGDLVAEAVARSERTTGAAGRTTVEPMPAVTLSVDVDALRQVLENLLVNAATHGGLDVRVTVRATASASGLVLAVEDDGPGVPPEEAARVFEPFGRGDRARAVPGFGLGLAIARDLVTAHGGTIAVESPVRPGDARPGTRFLVRVPASRVRAG
ncbi:MAG: HAMP domain-containing histidine kinase [Planctomycetes bacterium]|nr:HAMP domain-containing histidine kinase [Planctomycetota bacterium]